MQPPSPTASSTPPVVAPDAIQVTVRSSRGDGTRALIVEAPASGTIADVKQLLCRPPHSMCSDASTLVLVLKGKGAAVAAMRARCSFSPAILFMWLGFQDLVMV